MPVTLTNAKSILIRPRRIDSWFVSRAHLNLYRGCTHDCAYCDGRYEGYRVAGDFGRDIVARSNAPMLLDAALNPHRKRNPISSGFIMLGGGVSDSYQPAEKTLCLARQCLEVILKWRQPVHILTKSTLVERDMELLLHIHQVRAALLSISFSTVDDRIARIYEPGCPPPSARLRMMERMIRGGIPVGMFLLPVIPGISDSAANIDESVSAAAAIGASYVVFGGMTLKPGRQMSHFETVIQKAHPTTFAHYPKIFGHQSHGAADFRYYQRIEQRFVQSARKHQLNRRIPPALFATVCNTDDRIAVIVDQLDYLQRAVNDHQPFKKLSQLIRSTKNTPELNGYTGLSDNLKSLLGSIIGTNGQIWYDTYL
ncbi:MAG: radical SAM protein [Deltaproteobacteria bacterium]|nr:radical SAM protein [Deltaproteobacteria bacterium]